MTDFIIVGRGLAASVLAHTFHKEKLSFKIIGDETLSTCSKVAAGIWNPVVFKRLTKSWLAEDLVPYLLKFYSECELRLQKKIITERPIIKPFTEDHEKALWLKKSKTELEKFLDPTLCTHPSEELKHLKITNGYGHVKHCGNLNVLEFLNASTSFFKDKVWDEIFDHQQLRIQEEKVTYRTLEAKNIIFCEGFLVKNNPLFSWIPLKPAKGEILTISIPELELRDTIFNRDGFLMDVEGSTFKAGATYAWDDLSQEPTENGLRELNLKLKNMITCEYSKVRHEAGIRPSSLDRRPIIGAHPHYKNAFVFNGLGTKGVMLAPYFAKNYVNFYLQKEPLNGEVDIKRFYQLYGKKN